MAGKGSPLTPAAESPAAPAGSPPGCWPARPRRSAPPQPTVSPASGPSRHAEGVPRAHRASAHAAPIARTRGRQRGEHAERRYSASTMRSSCERVAPRVRRSAPSRIRWKRLVASAPTSTSVPVARVNSAMKRIASATRSTRRSRARLDERDVERRHVRHPLGEPALERAAHRGVLGAGEEHRCPRRRLQGPRAKTTKKFGSKRAQSTSRRLATRVGSALPARPRRSRRPPGCRARRRHPSPTEIWGCPRRASTTVPPTRRSEATSESR